MDQGTVESSSKHYPQISIKEFLDFVKTAYQVQGSLEGVLLANGMTDAVDWLKLKENNLVKAKSATAETKEVASKKSISENDEIKRKLSEVLSEGLLDSVLPYLVPNSQQNSRKSSLTRLASEKKITQISISTNSIKLKKNNDAVTSQALEVKPESTEDVEIHVCDEVNNTKKDFVCNKNLLLEKMGYFAEVTIGQRLEDMDISVHCDIGIFDWLMKWVKKDSLLEEDWPKLDPKNVIPILVSAAFLQMEPLQNDCLLFSHEYMNDILRTSTNLSCLNDSILTQLAAMYTNREVEAIYDKKDKIQSRIFKKLIQSLIEPDPESVRGHWSSLSRLYRCCKCQQLVTPAVYSKIPCIPSCMQMQFDGSVTSQHIRDSSWNINDYILKLYKTFKSWRKVYWRLWGDAHFLFCMTCKRYFPAYQIGWCRHHPDSPQYFTLDVQKAPLPVGRYPCCGERAYRFQLLQDYSGCQFREHIVGRKDVKNSAILGILEDFREIIEDEPPQLMFPERLTRLVARDTTGGDSKKLVCKENFWWEGFQIVPPRRKLGLLSNFANRGQTKEETPPPSEESSDENVSESNSSSSSSTENSSSVENGSAESDPPIQVRKTVRRVRRKKQGHLWQHNLSARSNQDIQRAYEEGATKEMTTLLNRRVTNVSEGTQYKIFSRYVTPMGGIWVRLENEFKETNSIPTSVPKNRSIFTGKPRIRTGSKIT